MKKYIDLNTEKRMKYANDFEKDFFKLMINSVYGKTMENLRKSINVRLVNNEEDQKIFMKNFLSAKICLNLVIIQKIQSFLMKLIKKLLAK